MKKLLSIVLILVMVVAMTACAPQKTDATTAAPDTTGTEAATTGAATEGGSDNAATLSIQAETGWMPYYEAVIERVKAQYPKATFKLIEVGAFDHLDTIDKTDVTNSDVADVFALPADRIAGLAKNQALAALDAKAMAEALGGFGDYDKGFGGNLMVDGDYLAFPMNIETLILFANSANAEANGVDLSKVNELTEMNALDLLMPAFNAWFGVAVTNTADIELLGKQADGSLYSDLTADWKDLPAEKQAVFTALFTYWKAHNDAQTGLWDKDGAGGYMDSEFKTGGKNSLRLEGPWSTGSLSTLAGEGADLDILPIGQVTVNGKPLAHWQGGWGLGVNARIEGKADEMELASAVIKEIVNPEYAVDFFKATGKILVNVDVDTYLGFDLPESDKEVISAVIKSYEGAPARPLFAEWGSVWDTWQNALLSWSAVKPDTVEDAYVQVQASFKAMMQNF